MVLHLAQRLTLETLYFTGVQAASRPLVGGLGGILMLHRVCEPGPGEFHPNSQLSVRPAFLDEVIATLKRRGFRFVGMDGLLETLKGAGAGKAREPMVAITLDDGYRDNLENAVPIFRKHDVPYTIFIAPGLVDGPATLWWEDIEAVIARSDHLNVNSSQGRLDCDLGTTAAKRSAFARLARLLTTEVGEDEQRDIVAGLASRAGYDAEAHRRSAIMNWDEIKMLAADPLCTIGAHTMAHFALARLNDRRALAEIVDSIEVLADRTGKRPGHFAYPYGYASAAGAREFALAREAGLASAVTTRHGVLYPEHRDHLHALPRISMNGNFQAMRYVDTMLSGVPTRLQNRGAAMSVA